MTSDRLKDHARARPIPVGLASFRDRASYTDRMTSTPRIGRRATRIAGPLAVLVLLLAHCDRAPEPEAAPTTSASPSPVTPPAAPPAEPRNVGATEGSLRVMAGSVPFEIVPESIDFGAVAPGSINEGTFRIRNLGDKSVRVVRATPSCVCTTLTDLTGVAVPPGGSVELAASLDAPTVPGEKDAKVFVVLEGMEQPAIVKLVGVVTFPVQPTPAYADALKGVTEGVIGLASTDGRPFRVLASNGEAPRLVGGDASEPTVSCAVRWSIAGMSPTSIPKWWVFSTDHPDCPLVACRVRNEETGAKRDPDRFERRWIAKDDFVQLGRIAVGESVEVPMRLTHYNPRGGGAVDRPEWSSGVSVRSVDPRLEATLVSAVPAGPDAVDLVVRLVPKGPATPLLYLPIEVSTATGRGEVEIAAMVVAEG